MASSRLLLDTNTVVAFFTDDGQGVLLDRAAQVVVARRNALRDATLAA